MKKYNLDLPDSYKRFILQQNGGVPEPCQFLNQDKYIFGIALFYAIRLDPLDIFDEKNKTKIMGSVDMIEDNQIIEGNLHGKYYPFAGDMGGSVYCISMDSSDYGVIYKCFWDGSNKISMCTSFEAFIDGLGDYEDWN